MSNPKIQITYNLSLPSLFHRFHSFKVGTFSSPSEHIFHVTSFLFMQTVKTNQKPISTRSKFLEKSDVTSSFPLHVDCMMIAIPTRLSFARWLLHSTHPQRNLFPIPFPSKNRIAFINFYGPL